MIRLGLLGASGRMGLVIRNKIEAQMGHHFTMVSAPRRNDPMIPLLDTDVVIDFSSPSAVLDVLRTLAGLGRPLPPWVIGSTGWNPIQEAELARYSDRMIWLKAANFSPGVWILDTLLRDYGKLFVQLGYACQLIETHHTQKKDAPSGTALRLKQTLLEQGIDPHVQSLRTGEVVGDHRIEFHGLSEKMIFEHQAIDRGIFAQGALEVARWLVHENQKTPPRFGPRKMSEFLRAKTLE